MTTRKWLAAAAIPAVVAGLLTSAAPASAIVGGTDANGLYRAMVDVQRQHADGTFSLTCGGAAVSERGRIGVLTGAHCVTDDTGAALPAEQIRLAVGSTIRDAGRITTLTDIGVPPGWDWGTPGPDGNPDQVDDWAVLLPANTRGLHPIPISQLTHPTRLRLIGWGSTKASGEGPLPDRLQQLDGSRIVDPQHCAPALISTGVICVESPKGSGVCYGDSGSPALTRAHARCTLRATASRILDKTCGTSNSVYTDASYLRTDIARMLLTGGTNAPVRTQTLTAANSNRHLWPVFPNPAN